MLRLAHLEELPRERPVFLALGTFDGVHRGHGAVLRALLNAARRAEALPAALTFQPHPAAVLMPEAAPSPLTTADERARLIAAFGVEALVELRFDRSLAEVPADVFAAGYLCGRGKVTRAFVGANFTFGRGGTGRPADLAQLLPVTVVPPVLIAGAPVSSTRVRAAVEAGQTGLVRRLLGRPYAVTGQIVPGAGRGRTLGFPTANVVPDDSLITPATGVYSAVCEVEGVGPGPLAGVANLGVRPTFGGGDVWLEVHLFDYAGELYGRRVRVALVRRLRGERRFADVSALVRQIERDAARARRELRAE